MSWSFRKIFGIFVGILFFIFLSQIASSTNFNEQSPLEIVFLDVGQGDAILINYLNHHQILIDGGPDGKKLMYEIGKVMPKDDKEIEVVILTHPDWDHFGGLIDLLDYYSIKSFLTSDIGNEKESFQKLVAKMQENTTPINLPEIGSRIDIGEYLDIEILNPDSDDVYGDSNERSIVARLDFGENSFLFTGDIGQKSEQYLVKEFGDSLDVDWLKIAHHGSKNSSFEAFLERTTPAFSAISVGENNYGHPTPEVLERIENIDSKIFRTDELGSIIVGCQTPKQDSCKILN